MSNQMTGRIIPNEIDLTINITQVNGKKAILLRKYITDPIIIQEYVNRAINNDPFVARIVFKDTFRSALRLREEGLIK